MSTFIDQPANITRLISTSLTTDVDNDTSVNAIFRVTGSVYVHSIYGVVTTVLGANHTAAYLRLNDQTAQLDITLNTGTTLSAAPAGSVIIKKGLAGAALTLKSSAAGAVSEPTTLETDIPSPILLTKKTGANTDIEYVYTSTDSPTSGVIQFFIEYRPYSADGVLTAL